MQGENQRHNLGNALRKRVADSLSRLSHDECGWKGMQEKTLKIIRGKKRHGKNIMSKKHEVTRHEGKRGGHLEMGGRKRRETKKNLPNNVEKVLFFSGKREMKVGS